MSSRPAVYVGTYHKYASGSIRGGWVNPGDFDTYEDFMDACSELHKDEPEGMREFMFQDKEYLPDKLYSESYFSRAAFEHCKAADEIFDPDALEAYAELFTIPEDADAGDIINDFNEHYHGYFDSDVDAVYDIVEDEMAINNVPDFMRRYFDYEEYARDMMTTDFDECNGYYFWLH